VACEDELALPAGHTRIWPKTRCFTEMSLDRRHDSLNIANKLSMIRSTVTSVLAICGPKSSLASSSPERVLSEFTCNAPALFL
jgi:hypothetical protein